MKLSDSVSDPTVSQCTVPITGHNYDFVPRLYQNILRYYVLSFSFLSPEKFSKLSTAIFSMCERSPLTCNRRKMQLDVLWTNISQKSLDIVVDLL